MSPSLKARLWWLAIVLLGVLALVCALAWSRVAAIALALCAIALEAVRPRVRKHR